MVKRSARANKHTTFRRMALAPGLLGAIVAIVGVSAIGKELFFVVSFVISLLALIVGWYAVQSRQWWWLPLQAAIAVVWNPVYPLTLAEEVWPLLQYLAAAGFIVAGLLIREPENHEK